MLDILRRLEEMLRKYSYTGQANFVEGAAHALRSGADDEFREAITGNGIWGTAGSVSDVVIAGRRDAPDGIREDEKQFRADIIALAEELEKESLGTPRSRFIAGVMRDWNARAI